MDVSGTQIENSHYIGVLCGQIVQVRAGSSHSPSSKGRHGTEVARMQEGD